MFKHLERATQLKPKATDIVLCVMSSKKGSALRNKSWLKGAALKGAIKEKFTKALSSWEAEEESIFTCQVPRTEGGAIKLMVFIPESDAFERQEALRKLWGKTGDKKNTVFADFTDLSESDASFFLECCSTLSLCSSWKPTRYGKAAKKAEKKPDTKNPLTVHYFTPALNAISGSTLVELGLAKAAAINTVRTLSEMPANELSAKNYVAYCKQFAKEKGLKFEYWNQKSLEALGAGAFLAVSRADPQADCGIVKLTYSPKRKNSHKAERLSLVGKGLCYDTGGYNIKTGQHMNGMHRDMTGSALALSMIGLYSQLKLSFEVECFLAIAENLISPTAYKPNEVVVASNGLAIEVVDTDAEGRMVLSDTLALASKQKPDLLIDYATLTGAVVRSIDTRRAGIFSNQEKLLMQAHEAGQRSGDRTWPFPIGKDYLRSLKSDIADIRQCAVTNNSDHIYAATFLSKFVAQNVPWVHVDIAGVSENKGGLGLCSTENTGFGVHWTYEFVKSQLKS